MAAFFERIIDKVRGYDEDDYDYYDELSEDDDYESEDDTIVSEKWTDRFKGQSRVVDFSKAKNTMQHVVIIQPSSIESAQEVCNHLRNGRTVICNFEKIEQKIAQRVMDFVTGASYAIDGQVHKISSMIFVAVPKNVSLSDENNPINMEYLGLNMNYASK